MFYVYFLTNARHTVIYIGVTNNLVRRLAEHRADLNPASFTCRYRVHKLVYYESGGSAAGAIAREKQLKAGSRRQKLDLINSLNPEWRDLSEGWER